MSTSQPTTREAINVASAGSLAGYTQQVQFGNVLRSLPVQLFQQSPATNSYNLTTVQVITLPDNAKCGKVIRAWARAGTGNTATGELTVAAIAATPQTGEVATTPNGDIGFLGTDALTGIDVLYQPLKGDVVEFSLPVATGILTIPTAYTTAPRGVFQLIEAEALTGTNTGKKIILAASASLPATTKACLSQDRTQVLFNNATDAVTSARVKLLVNPAVDMNAILEASASF